MKVLKIIQQFFAMKKSNSIEEIMFNSFKKALGKGVDFSDFSKIYYIDSIEYDSTYIENLKVAIFNNNLNLYLDKVDFKKDRDAIELYIIEKPKGELMAYFLYDPVEFFENKSLLDKIEINHKLNFKEIDGIKTIKDTKD